MEPFFLLRNFSKPFKSFIFSFLIVLSIGYFTGLLFVAQTDSTSPKGMVENYNGNEEVKDAAVLKFKKGEREMLTILHSHILSIGFIFAFLGVLVWGTELPLFWKKFFMIEPFLLHHCNLWRDLFSLVRIRFFSLYRHDFWPTYDPELLRRGYRCFNGIK